MRNNGIGGMQSAASHYSIICPKCGKPAARIEESPTMAAYMHFTKAGSVWHIRDRNGNWTRRQRAPQEAGQTDGKPECGGEDL